MRGLTMGSVPGKVTVLYVVAYPYRMAGANRSLLALASALPEGYRAIVMLTDEGPVAEAFRSGGITAVVVHPPGPLSELDRTIVGMSVLGKLRTLLRDAVPYTLELRRVMRWLGPDIVHVNEPRSALLAGLAARLVGAPVVAHLRGEFPFGVVTRLGVERAATRIVCVSEGARRTLSRRGQRKAITVYNGIGKLPESELQLGFLTSLRDRGVRVVCCFASVVPFKGHHHLVDAISILNRRGWSDRLAVVCVGDLPDRHSYYHRFLAARIARYKVGNITFTGWSNEPMAFYREADLTVLASVSKEVLRIDGNTVVVRGSEGFPRTHLEAMQVGIAVVGTRVAGVPEQVEDRCTGLLVEPGDAVAMADALEVLLGDPELASSMGHCGRLRVAERFSIEQYVAGVTSVYEDLVDPPGTGRRAEGV